jgi:hypothetical protein
MRADQAGDHGNVTGDVTGPFGALGTSVPIWATRYDEPETRIAAIEGGRPENRNGCLRDSRLRPRGLRPPVGPGPSRALPSVAPSPLRWRCGPALRHLFFSIRASAHVATLWPLPGRRPPRTGHSPSRCPRADAPIAQACGPCSARDRPFILKIYREAVEVRSCRFWSPSGQRPHILAIAMPGASSSGPGAPRGSEHVPDLRVPGSWRKKRGRKASRLGCVASKFIRKLIFLFILGGDPWPTRHGVWATIFQPLASHSDHLPYPNSDPLTRNPQQIIDWIGR